ncbi:MAG: class I SAM-dependent methyltransferase [Candidatus Nanohalobium sp.]
MNSDENYDINSGEDIERGRENGVWADTTTQPNRYDDLLEGLHGRVDYDEGEQIDVLDIGCSRGVAGEYFASELEDEYGIDVNIVGVDANQDAVDEASERLDDAYLGMAQDLDFEEGDFDIVTSKTLLSRISGEDQTEALQEIDRVVGSEGYAAVQLDPKGREGITTGHSYVMTGQELTEVGQETVEDGEAFASYPMDDVLEQYQFANFMEEQEEEVDTDQGEGSETGTFDELIHQASRAEETKEIDDDDDDDIIVA